MQNLLNLNKWELLSNKYMFVYNLLPDRSKLSCKKYCFIHILASYGYREGFLAIWINLILDQGDKGDIMNIIKKFIISKPIGLNRIIS